MRTALTALGLALSLTLGGCATEDVGYGSFGLGYNAYYDDFYGPYYGGYWGPDHTFWYRPGPGGAYVHDAGHHFHNHHDPGFHGVHAGRPPSSGGQGQGRHGSRPGGDHGADRRH